jgi:hypothetical protein
MPNPTATSDAGARADTIAATIAHVAASGAMMNLSRRSEAA